MNMEYHIVVVGAGGTGGNFIKELGRFLSYYRETGHSWKLSIIDGDTVEARNTERQPFMVSDTMQHKSSVMAEALVDCLNLPQDKVTAYTQYIDEYRELKEIIGCSGKYSSVVILVGCVDNHRARQVMHTAFEKISNIIYLDSANEFSEGEVVCGVRIEGKEVAPPRGYYFPEVLTDNGLRASEQSCGVINESAPQHLITNLTAAQHLLSFVVNIMKNGVVEGGVVHFNAFTHFCRFDHWTPEMQASKDAIDKAEMEESKRAAIMKKVMDEAIRVRRYASNSCDGEKVTEDGE